jgi:hypothetical protein
MSLISEVLVRIPKPLKRLSEARSLDTGLKPGVNETAAEAKRIT